MKEAPASTIERPSPAVIRNTRVATGRSVKEAASLVHRTARNWVQWEKGDRQIDLAAWELFLIKTNKGKQ